MSSNLVPTQIVDRNGHSRTVYKTVDGRGTPTLKERNAYKSAAKSVPSFSPYKDHNVIYADDFFVADADSHNSISHARQHEDGSVELITYVVTSNIDLSSEDVSALGAINTTFRTDIEGFTPAVVELAQGGTARFRHDGSLVFTTDDGETTNDLSGYDSGKLIDQLAKWSS
jgi:hypothetical protein